MSICHLELYATPGLRSARVVWLLHELGIDDFAMHYLNLFDGENYEPKYLAINPNHGVPTLVVTFDDGEKISLFESAAIIQFLADSFPHKKLAPRAEPMTSERAIYLRTLYFGAATVDMILWQIRIHESILERRSRDPKTAVRYRKKFHNEIEPQLAAPLARHEYICGDSFSAADCFIGYSVRWARRYDMCKDEVFDRYMRTLQQRDAFVKAFSDVPAFSPTEVPNEAPIVALFSG